MDHQKAGFQSAELIPQDEDLPSSEQINALMSLFVAGNYHAAIIGAKSMTERFPSCGFAWRALGTLYNLTGCCDAALAPLQRALTLLPTEAEAHNNIAFTFTQLGRFSEAVASYQRALLLEPDFAEAYCNYANMLRRLGRLDEAALSYRRAVDFKPDSSEAYSNQGDVLYALNQLSEAHVSFQRALQLQPDDAAVYNNVGNVLTDLGRLDEAGVSYRRALAIQPVFAEGYSNLGYALMGLGRLNEAEAALQRAVQINANFAGAFLNLGNLFRSLGRQNLAEDNYRYALSLKPDYSDAYNNLALLLNAQRGFASALNFVKKSLQLEETVEAKSIFVDCVKRMPILPDDRETGIYLVRALTEPWGRSSELVRLSVNYLKQDRLIGRYVARAAELWSNRLLENELFESRAEIANLANDTLLRAVLESAANCDIGMERFLTLLRYILLKKALEARAGEGEDGVVLRFFCALAQQCFINEYVFSFSAAEIERVDELRNSLAAALQAKNKIPALWLVAVAAYFPLYSLPFSEQILHESWPTPLMAVLRQQIHEPLQERQLRNGIARLTHIEDEVSLLVQRQYEENPYPRWFRMAADHKAKNIVVYLSEKFPLARFKRYAIHDTLDVLIAGCGTGQHSIATAQLYRGAYLLAVDLSLSSLSYAKRKTQECGLTSIEYAQADLLTLGSLQRSFDVIESVGVLHHLADPWQGWRVLLSLLRSGGFMKLGFYSATARRNIEQIRNFIAEQGYAATAAEIRRFRQDAMDAANNAVFNAVLETSDFFTISTCRDLLFHVQEHQLTLPEIEAFLKDNCLTFIGFDVDATILHAYKQRFPDDQSGVNLGQWHIFENENPDTFIGMYQFWIQK